MNIAENPLAGGTFLNWLRLLWDNHPVKLKYLPRVFYISSMTLLSYPLRLLQRLLFSRKIKNTRVTSDPVFVLGHYRSGGTHFMNMLTRDTQWGFLSTTQALLPDLFLLGTPVRNIFQRFLHEKRPMDNMQVTPDSPEEVEHAIGNMIPYGFYQGLCFPGRMMEYIRNSVNLEAEDNGKIRKLWENSLTKLIRACTLANSGRQLLLKNPPDMARIPMILKLYPQAKFIFIQRNPFVLFPSIKNFLKAYIADWQLSDIDDITLEENILAFYELFSVAYQRDKEMIPRDHLVEVKFEDFEKDPLGVIRRIYDQLGLSGFKEAKAHFQDYVGAQKDYKKNLYSLTQSQIDILQNRWSVDIQRWNYTPEEGVKVIS